MQPIQPQVPGYDEFVIAKDQPEYIPLPAILVPVEGVATVVTRWRLTDEERAAVANGADIWLQIMTGGAPLQPIRIATDCMAESLGEPS